MQYGGLTWWTCEEMIHNQGVFRAVIARHLEGLQT